jgi:hypothetical protein
MYITHPETGVHKIPGDWLDGFAPSGFRPATPAEIEAWHAERGLTPPGEGGAYCPCCLKRVPPREAHREVQREECASGVVDVVLYRCPACGLALFAVVQSNDGETI